MITLQPIKELPEDFDELEKAVKQLFLKEIYIPIMKALGGPTSSFTLKNSKRGLEDALRSGRITFSRGTFSGKLSAEISKELRALGATFNRKEGTYKLPLKELPASYRALIAASESAFKSKIEAIDKILGEVSPEGVASKVSFAPYFDRVLWKTEKKFQASVKNITVSPELSVEARKRVSEEWGENMQLWIKDFTQKEIIELRQSMFKSVSAGDRYGSAIETIKASYGVSANKAKFLARQETMLLMTKFKQTRYQAAGVDCYRWGCVTGSAAHPVRKYHLANKDKVFRWDDPPIVDAHGARKNPGQDYNCRCFARPIVNYTGKLG